MLFRRKRLVASTDPVAADASVAKLFWNLEVDALLYLKFARKPGFGTCEFENSSSNNNAVVQIAPGRLVQQPGSPVFLTRQSAAYPH